MSLDLLPDGEFEELKKRLSLARKQRTYNALAKIDPQLAMTIAKQSNFEVEKVRSLKETSAITLQRIARGIIDRKIYADLLFENFEKEEQERERMKQLQLKEGEALLHSIGIEKQMQDDRLVWRNRCAVNNHKAVIIQRFYRKWRNAEKVLYGRSKEAESPLHNMYRNIMEEKYSCSAGVLRTLPPGKLRSRHQMLHAELKEQNRLLNVNLQKRDELIEKLEYLHILSKDLIERIGPGYIDIKTGKHKKGYKRPTTKASVRDKFEILM